MTQPRHALSLPAHRVLRMARRLPGFSLVEVLMAVLILALALLGLGAVMPAVVKQQRVGADQTFGTIASRSVAAWVRGNASLNDPKPTAGMPILQTYGRWEAWARATDNTYGAYRIPLDGSWLVLEVDGINTSGTGQAIIGPTQGPGYNATTDQAFINLADRLIPSITTITTGTNATAEPQFVVDLAVRRVTPIEAWQTVGGVLVQERPGNFTVQMALVTRRVDQRLRTNPGTSVMAAVADVNTATADRLWPISEDNAGNPLGDGSTNNGARYALPYTVSVGFDPATPDRLVVQGVDDSRLLGGGTQRTNQVAARQMAAAGQTLIDNLGNVYTVVGGDDRTADPLDVRISPPVGGGIAASGSGTPRRLWQVLVCPQAPAAVSIITVNP